MDVGSGFRMYDVIINKFMFAISSPDEFLSLCVWESWVLVCICLLAAILLHSIDGCSDLVFWLVFMVFLSAVVLVLLWFACVLDQACCIALMASMHMLLHLFVLYYTARTSEPGSKQTVLH